MFLHCENYHWDLFDTLSQWAQPNYRHLQTGYSSDSHTITVNYSIYNAMIQKKKKKNWGQAWNM